MIMLKISLQECNIEINKMFHSKEWRNESECKHTAWERDFLNM